MKIKRTVKHKPRFGFYADQSSAYICAQFVHKLLGSLPKAITVELSNVPRQGFQSVEVSRWGIFGQAGREVIDKMTWWYHDGPTFKKMTEDIEKLFRGSSEATLYYKISC